MELKEGGTSWMFIKIPDEWRRKQEEKRSPAPFIVSRCPFVVREIGDNGDRAVLQESALGEHAGDSLAPIGFLVTLGAGCLRTGRRLRQPDTKFLKRLLNGDSIEDGRGGDPLAILLGAVFYAGGLAVLFGLASYFSNRAFGEERLPVGGPMPESIIAMRCGSACAGRPD